MVLSACSNYSENALIHGDSMASVDRTSSQNRTAEVPSMKNHLLSVVKLTTMFQTDSTASMGTVYRKLSMNWVTSDAQNWEITRLNAKQQLEKRKVHWALEWWKHNLWCDKSCLIIWHTDGQI